jgi:RecB family endonuclease NucS
MSNNDKFGRLERVELRDENGWPTEAGDFTPWLASPENIELLGKTIGLELEVEAREKAVGLFRADILCKDTANQTWVLIENQLEKTDHGHLGQLITYADHLGGSKGS